MRIHRLKFSSIGPYAQPQELDFDVLSEAGVFLFTGPTGAGKSTVLDAISLALYNAPVKKRGDRAEAVVSNHADLQAHPPEVEMDFSVGEHRYRIHRRLSHSSYAKRGQRRLVPRPGTVNLHRIHGQSLIPLGNRQDEVGRQIEDIVHLNRDQFTKVMMLPQGEFAEFLTANSEDRRQILERLFDTGRFLRVTELLKEHAKQAREQFQEQLQHQERLQHHLLSRAGHVLGWTAGEEQADFDQHIEQIQQQCSAELTELTRTVEEGERRRSELAGQQQRIAEELQAVQSYRNYEQRQDLLEQSRTAFQSADQQLNRHHSAMKLWADVRHDRHAQQRLETATEAADRARQAADDTFGSASWLSNPAELGNQAEQLESDREAIALAISADKTATQLRTQLAEKAAAADAATATQQQLQQQDTELTEQLQSLLQRLTGLPDQTGAIEAIEEQQADYAMLAPAREALERATGGTQTRIEAHLERQQEHLLARDAHSQLLQKQYAQARLLLASQLSDGEPCAVCGSTDHPAPAQVSESDDQLVTQAALDRAKAAEAAAETAMTQAAGELDTARRQQQQSTERYRVLLESLKITGVPGPTEPDPDLLTAEIDTAVARHGEHLAGALAETLAKQQQRTSALKEQERLNAAVAQAEQQRQDLARELERLNATQQTLRSQLAEQETICRPWLSSHGDLEQARAQTVRKLAQLRELQEATQALQQARTQAETARGTLDDLLAESSFADAAAVEAALLTGTALTEAQEQVTNFRAEEAQLAELARQEPVQRAAQLDRSQQADQRRAEEQESLAAEVQELAESLRDHQGRVGELNGFRRELAEGLQELHVLADEQRQELAEVTHAGHVAGVADGTDNDRRISLPIYVLAAKLEKVAAEASRHLLEMTDGRYQIRYDDERSGTAKAGLGLKISDSWTGQDRGTRSLSGGESFMASLALALGLADVVQQESGGIAMETLFIDEGFGSLDSATLDEVMKTIQRLFDYGRVVGLVSHVEDMKNDIPTQIRIAATAQGSTARIVTG